MVVCVVVLKVVGKIVVLVLFVEVVLLLVVSVVIFFSTSTPGINCNIKVNLVLSTILF